MYAIMEQAGQITSVRILEMGLTELRLRRPKVEFHLIQPDPTPSPLRGPSMGFEASRAGLRFGYSSVKQWLATEEAGVLKRRFETPAAASGTGVRYFSLLSKAKPERPA
jgi:hypothetical protein